jgi:hypothetical protein
MSRQPLILLIFAILAATLIFASTSFAGSKGRGKKWGAPAPALAANA